LAAAPKGEKLDGTRRFEPVRLIMKSVLESEARPLPADRPRLYRLLAVLRPLVVVVAIMSMIEWINAMAVRLTNPYPVEWLEGAFVAHSLRVLAGRPIYVPPTAEFIPNLYPPLAYWAQALAMKVLGPGLPAARWVSVLSTVGVAYLMGAVVYRSSRSRVAAIAVAGLFLDAYAICGGWYDQARNDMIFLFIGLGSLIVVTSRPSIWSAILAALLASLATWTRQQGLGFVALCFLHLFLTARKQALVFAVTVLAINVPAITWLDRTTNGWFLRYTWTTLGDYTIHYDKMPAILHRFATNLSLLFLATMIWLVINVRLRRLDQLLSVWTLGLGVFSASAVLSMIKEGGTVNHLIPVVVFALIIIGLAIGDFAREKLHPVALAVALSILVVQYMAWPRPVTALVPKEVRTSQRQVVETIRAIPGPVLALDDPYYLHLAGKPMHADGGTLFWLSFMGLELPADLAGNIAGRQYDAILLSNPVEKGIHVRTQSGRRLNRLIDENYTFSRQIIPEDGAIMALRLPRFLYLPKPAGAPLASLPSRSLASGLSESSSSTRRYQATASSDRPR
jgi:hypothetical protein